MSIDRRRFLSLLTLAALGGAFPVTAHADFYAYIARPEPAYRWEKVSEKKVDGGTVHELHLVSQTWQDHVWEHRLLLFWPETLDRPGYCTLLNTGGGGGPAEEAMGALVARQAGMPFAILFHIPKQPLYDGKVEDELIVYTWKKYIETGDESWPLHFPMAKAVLKAMDALQAYTKEAGVGALERFIITGASKRGWTTWLVGASKDKRVAAIAPMVIDVLNVPRQLAHQMEAYGQPSEQVGDYTSAGIDKILASPQGKRLMELEDPYSYRDVLTLPKLILLGTNDRYWSQDALNLYWDDLKGLKWVLYTPNSGHGLEDRVRVLNTLVAFSRAIAGRKRWPSMKWEYQATPASARLRFESDVAPVSARLFHAAAATRDFRDARWTSDELPVAGKGFAATYETPVSGFVAIFGEATYELEKGRAFTLSTQIRILEGKTSQTRTLGGN